MSSRSSTRMSFGAVLSQREFRWLWIAEVQSEAGDQLARVAISVLVYDWSHSAALTALIYALTFLPAIVAGPIAGRLADQLPRRTLMIAGDLTRAALVGLMCLPDLPVAGLAGLVVGVVVVGTIFSTAQSSMIADVVRGEAYPVAIGLRNLTNQASQVLGFAVGGAVVALLGARGSLALDAATFAVSALIVRWAVAGRPAPAATGEHANLSLSEGVRRVLANRRLRNLLGYSWLLGLTVVPEGLAAPYAAQVGGGPVAIGFLLAANPAGSVLGALIVTRLDERRRAASLAPLAVLTGVPLVACLAHPGVPAAFGLWMLSGVATCYQIQVVTEFMRTVPNGLRGRGVGLASSGLLAAQGIGIGLGGILAQLTSAGVAIAAAGALAIAAAVFLSTTRSSSRKQSGEPECGD